MSVKSDESYKLQNLRPTYVAMYNPIDAKMDMTQKMNIKFPSNFDPIPLYNLAQNARVLLSFTGYP